MPEQWFYRMFGDEFGPVSLDDLREFATNGTLSGNDEVRPEALTMWVPAKAVRELQGFYENAVESAAAVTTTMNTAASSPTATDEWYYRMTDGDDAEVGPLTFDALIELAEAGRLTADDDVRWGVHRKWRRAGSMGRLMAVMPYRARPCNPSSVSKEDQILDELMASSRKPDVALATGSVEMPSASPAPPRPAQSISQDSWATNSCAALPSSASISPHTPMPSTPPPIDSRKPARSGPSLAEHLKNPIIWKGLAALVVVGLPICWMNMSHGDPGPERVPVTGIITYMGRPIERLMVTFSTMDASRGSYGETNDKGEFFLSTLSTNDGAYVGENLITLRPMSSKPPPSPAADTAKSYSADMAKSQADAVRRRVEERNKNKKTSAQNSAEAGELRIPAKYLDPLKSGLTRGVVPGRKNYFEIELND